MVLGHTPCRPGRTSADGCITSCFFPLVPNMPRGGANRSTFLGGAGEVGGVSLPSVQVELLLGLKPTCWGVF